MDTITHGIVGALVGKAIFAGHDIPANSDKRSGGTAVGSATSRVAIAACTLGAIFPDIDIFAGPLARNPLAIMEWHRNITHSAVLLPLWALLLAWLTIPLAKKLKCEAPPFLLLWAIYAVGLGTHIFLDLVTSFGTMVWSPLRYSRPAWDWIFIIDLTLSSIALVPQLAAWCYREPGPFRYRALGVWAALTLGAFGAYFFADATGFGFPVVVSVIASAILAAVIFLPAIRGVGFGWPRAAWCRAGLAVLCVYIASAATAHQRALRDVERFAAEQRLQAESVAALPLPPTLTQWVGLVSTPDGVWRTTFEEPSGAPSGSQLYVDAPPLPAVEAAKKLRDVQVYLWFARFPVWRIVRLPDGDMSVEISDVRFFRNRNPLSADDPPAPQRRAGMRSARAGFTFAVIFDPRGQIVSHGFKEPE